MAKLLHFFLFIYGFKGYFAALINERIWLQVFLRF